MWDGTDGIAETDFSSSISPQTVWSNGTCSNSYFYATADEGIAEQVVRLCDIKPPKGEATLVLLDLDDDGAYYLTNTSDVSEAALAKFLANPGKRQQLKSP